MRTTVITGAASGIGAALADRVAGRGERVISVDLHDASVVADLGSPGGRAAAVAAVLELAAGPIDAVAVCAGLGGLPDRPGGLLASVNYFGAVEVLTGLRAALAGGVRPAAVVISSNSATTQPFVPDDVVQACLAGDEEGARDRADAASSLLAYPATKLALARWVRRHAPTAPWIGAGITLNAVAPGPTATPLLDATRADPVIGPLLAEFPVPAERVATADEIAGALDFMLGPDARFLCGTFLVVDGGTDALLRGEDWPIAHQ